MKDGGPAFPSEQGHCPDSTWNQTYDPGVSLRAYIATAAMQGLMSGPADEWDLDFETIADVAVKQADALLKALEEGDA